MDGIDELRSTLDRHAVELVDHDLDGRVGSVRRRIGAARRQRRAAAAGGVALTLAAAGAVALLPEWGAPSAPEPASVAGVEVPTTMRALGYTFEYRDGVEGDDRVTIDLAPSDQPRLVSWGTSDSNDHVEITEGRQVTSYTVPDFSDYVWVDPGEEVSLTVAGSDEVGLAVYELTDDEPDGVSGDGVTFRKQVAGDLLLGATIGEPGESEVSVGLQAAGKAVDYRYFCAHGPQDATLHVDDGSGEVTQGRCGDEAPFDPAGGGGVSVVNDRDEVTVRLWVTDGPDGPRLDSDEVVLGLGVYDRGVSQRVTGLPVPELIEYDGHVWRASEHVPSDLGGRSVSVDGDGDPARPVLAVGYHAAGEATVVTEHNVTGEGLRSQGIGEVRDAVIGLLSAPSDTATMRVEGDVPDDARLLIVLFEQVD
ncbi:hypothetical protein LRP67_19240 [Nocardioides sp. cx-169]|uniref:hypothetical protein n=1 Tax=Nocardioides sp. cx-169 TaxID=2899080 RepID=UPI001E500A66|nr:hypothetical protein [Nocardioides sp. cx-169]MCD4536231.1 hypothetical protein [Nocardioides sp. cx-169]